MKGQGAKFRPLVQSQDKRQNAVHVRARLQMQQFEPGHLKKFFPRACAMRSLKTWFFAASANDQNYPRLVPVNRKLGYCPRL